MFEVVSEINHLAAGEIEVNSANGARSGCNLVDRFCFQVNAKKMVLSFHPCFEIDRLAIIGPFQASGNQIKSIRGQY